MTEMKGTTMTRLRAVAQVMQRCKSQMQAAGFAVKGSVATRNHGVLLQDIAVRASRNHTGEFQILLDVAILDPFLTKPAHVVCLRGYAGRGRAGHQQVWWKGDEVDEAASSLLAYGVPWLDSRGGTQRLIEIFERGIKTRRSVEDMNRGQQSNEVAESIVRSLFPKGPPQGFPFVYHHWLSLLHYHSVPQRISEAWAHAKEYSKYVPGFESERTLHQLGAMGLADGSENIS